MKSLAPRIVLQIAMVVLYVWGGVGRLVGIDQQRVENSMLPVNCLPEYFHKSKLILLSSLDYVMKDIKKSVLLVHRTIDMYFLV